MIYLTNLVKALLKPVFLDRIAVYGLLKIRGKYSDPLRYFPNSGLRSPSHLLLLTGCQKLEYFIPHSQARCLGASETHGVGYT